MSNLSYAELQASRKVTNYQEARRFVGQWLQWRYASNTRQSAMSLLAQELFGVKGEALQATNLRATLIQHYANGRKTAFDPHAFEGNELVQQAATDVLDEALKLKRYHFSLLFEKPEEFAPQRNSRLGPTVSVGAYRPQAETIATGEPGRSGGRAAEASL